MAAVSQQHINPPFFFETLSPYTEKTKVRYSIYALSILAIGAAAFRYGNTKIGLTLSSAGCFVQGYKIVQIAQEIRNNPRMDELTKKQKISRITDCIFKMGLMGGLIWGGLNLSLICHEGSLLLHYTPLLLKQKTPLHLIHAWLQNAPFFLSVSNNLAALGCLSIPRAYNLIRWSDDLFYFQQTTLAEPVFEFCKKVIKIWIAVKNEVTLDSLFFMLRDMVQTVHLGSYLSNLASEASPQMIAATQALRNSLTLLSRFPAITFTDLNQWIRSFSNPPESRVPVQSTTSKTKAIANIVFFHTLNFSLMAARLYHHFFPTVVFFILGLLYPTSYQTETTIRRSWEINPDFISLPLISKCRYIFDQTSGTVTALQWWNIPTAIFNGLYLAEDVRYYSRRGLRNS